MEDWLDYIIFSNPITALLEIEDQTDDAEGTNKRIYYLSAYDVMWILTNVYSMSGYEGYNIADINTITEKRGYPYARMVSKCQTKEYSGRYADYERSITTLSQNGNRVSLKLEFMGENEEEGISPFYVTARLEEKDQTRYWTFEYWGKDVSGEIQEKDESTGTGWREAYKKFLLEYDKKLSSHFDLVYIDEDDVPELVIMDGNVHIAKADVYVYDKEKVVFVHSYGQCGSFSFVLKENMIRSGYIFLMNNQ